MVSAPGGGGGCAAASGGDPCAPGQTRFPFLSLAVAKGDPYGSCLGDANSHSNENLPIILAGGGYRHPGHLAFDEKKNQPLANLFVTMLQRLGVEAESFSSSTGTLRGLDA